MGRRSSAEGFALDPDEYPIFTPLGAGTIVDDTRTWVDPNGYRLSGRIWNARAIDSKAIDSVLLQGIASGKSALATAKDLERFLTPEGSSSKTRYPTGRGSGSAAARRLARTETSRSFAVANLQADEANPFVDGSQWNLSGSHPEVDDCDDKARDHSPGMQPGEYRSDSFPRIPSHPHCLCYPTSVSTQDTDAVIASLLADANVEEQGAEQILYKGYDLTGLPPDDIEQVKKIIDKGSVPEAILRAEIEKERAKYAATMSSRSAAALSDDPLAGQLFSARDVAEDTEEFSTKRQRLLTATERWVKDLSSKQRQSIDDYAQFHFDNINRTLRREQSLGDLSDNVRLIDSAMNEAAMDQQVRVFRGLSSDSPLHSFNDPLIGLESTDLGYGSTTIDYDTAAHFAERGVARDAAGEVIEIIVPQGARAAYIEPISKSSEEFELLMARGTRYRVIGRSERGNIVVEVVL